MYIYYTRESLAQGAYGQVPFSHGRPPPCETLGLPRFSPVADQKELRIHDKTVHGNLWDDALQRKDSDAAIESFWRCTVVEVVFVVRGVPRGVPGASPGVPRGVPGGAPEVPGGSGESLVDARYSFHKDIP